MAGWLRRAGQGRAPDGAVVTWSVAEGRRGRRWREVVATGEGIRSSLLLELDPDGRFSHLELSTAAGLLTLHPEGDGTLHGNRVTADGVHHLRSPWDPSTDVRVEGSAVCIAAAPGRGGTQGWLRIRLDLRLDPTSDAIDAVATDGDGLPVLDGGASWPLELEG
ncbi:MAG TPA: hypothetical protein VID95_06425 [Candidatus Limnocylindrales bacterium]|jgi:hypothetical protein